MWKSHLCPICGTQLEKVDTNYHVYRFQCPQTFCIPDAGDSGFTMIRSHYEVNMKDDKPYHETMCLYPFIVDSYVDTSTISVYNGRFVPSFIIELPYLNLPWSDTEKTLEKLKLYVLMS